MDINEQMEAKWQEMTDVKNEREALFDNFEANKDKIAELHFEVEIKKLQYMLLKREQLNEISRTDNMPGVTDNVKSINESCIAILQKRLIEDGFRERLQQESLI